MQKKEAEDDKQEAEDKLEEVEDAGLCKICMDKKAEYAIQPCGHKCLCVNCKDAELLLCPICRQPKQRIQKIFDS